ncbi:fimbria/pilus outer membrane usher protein [Serratia ureilytica]|uniref:fimbria/pilus outer membrane usher protein n=1 Tax=Serratia ureilytica TaxID=300181 RepID=UPI003F6AC1A8
MLLILFITPVRLAIAQGYKFDASLLKGKYSDIDISMVENGLVKPGIYLFDIILNGLRIGVDNVKVNSKNGVVFPCFSAEQLSGYGIKTESYPLAKNQCFTIDSAIHGGKAEVSISEQAIRLSIPQVALRKEDELPSGNYWNDGINAGLINYYVNFFSAKNKKGDEYKSSWLALSPGINIGSWRLRSNTSWYGNNNERGKWQKGNTYIERGLYDIKSRLTLGENYTPTDIFDSIGFRGIMLSTDEEMVPYKQREYSPLVQGIAKTQAKVEVTQNGKKIYEETVAPGKFVLSDLSSLAQRGDLFVTVLEADGSKQEFTVAYQTPAISLKRGYLKYSLAVGNYFSPSIYSGKEKFTQATLAYGFPWDVTAFGGLQISNKYNALSLGVGKSLGRIGAISIDGTFSHSESENEGVEQGSAWRIRYSNYLANGTSLAMSSSQYTTPRYKTFQDSLFYNDRKNYLPRKIKSKTSITMGQSLGDFGSFNVNASYMNRYNSNEKNLSFGAGYNFKFNNATISVNYKKNKYISKSNKETNDSLLSAWLSIPLGDLFGSPSQVRWQINTGTNQKTQQEVGLNGTALDRRLNWDLSQRYQSNLPMQRNDSSTLSLGWSGIYGQVGGNYSYGNIGRQLGLNAAGGVVIHSEGVTLSQPLSQNIALVETPKVPGVSVNGWPGVKTDFRGYTTVSGLNAYRDNVISIDSKRLPTNAEILQTDIHSSPSKGAITKLIFSTRVGLKALMKLSLTDGRGIPFGARVSNESGTVQGLVSSDSNVYLSGLPASGVLAVDWDRGHCVINFHLNEKDGDLIKRTREVCG